MNKKKKKRKETSYCKEDQKYCVRDRVLVAETAIIKYHKLGGLNNRNIFSYSSRGREFQDLGASQFNSIPNENSLPGLQAEGFPLFPQMEKREKASFLTSLLLRSLIRSDQCPTFMTSSNLNYFLFLT